MNRWRKLLLWSGLLLVLLVVLGSAAFVVWASAAAPPMPEALDALQSGAQVQVEPVEGEPWLVFRPADEDPETGLIFYPGGRVDPRAYAPAARAVAEAGYLAVIVPMPLNLAVFGADRAGEVIAAFPEVQHWAVGGHSLGGSMAARFAYSHPSAVQGLVLWASYPASGDDLSARDLAVVSVYGTRDGLASVEQVTAARSLLPPDTSWVAIEGGNHAQFGWYGAQQGDNAARVSREAQQAAVVEATLALLADLNE